MSRTSRPSRIFALLALVGGGASLCLLSGCYERTVAARGIGAAGHEISEPYQESGKLDEWIFGPTPSSKKITPMTRTGSRLE